MPKISGSTLYSAAECPHRVSMDWFGNRDQREEESDFLALLWEQGVLHEEAIIEALEPEPLDFSDYESAEKEAATFAAIAGQAPLIYGGRLVFQDLVGEPDLLRHVGNGEYVPGDIKSGRASGSDGAGASKTKLKDNYAVQIAHYVYLLEQLELSDGERSGFIVDGRGIEVAYDLTTTRRSSSAETWWEHYQQQLSVLRDLAAQRQSTRPALSAACKQCHWRTACREQLVILDDLTLIPGLGRAKRDVMGQAIPTVSAFAQAELTDLFDGRKTIFRGVGQAMLEKFQVRARLLTADDPEVILREPLGYDPSKPHLLFDIEDDPMRDICYLHGFVEVSDGGVINGYHGFFADEPTAGAEREVFQQAVEFLLGFDERVPLVHYSAYEKTTWKKLAERYPDVITQAAVLTLFDQRAFDLLYEAVNKHSEWPTNDYSIKTLAKYAGFEWRDSDPSGASSIRWYHNWTETGDPAIKQRILDYNEDDCVAMHVVAERLIKALSSN